MSDEEGAGSGPVVIPWQRLSSAALRGVLEEFVTREGTEYGRHDVSLDAKVAAVQRQLERGEVVVVFDGAEGSVNVVTTEELAQGAEPL